MLLSCQTAYNQINITPHYQLVTNYFDFISCDTYNFSKITLDLP